VAHLEYLLSYGLAAGCGSGGAGADDTKQTFAELREEMERKRTALL